MSPGWKVILLLGWVGGILGYATVWAVSRQIGLPPWWLGPRGAPQPLPILVSPFLLPVLMVVGIMSNRAHMPQWGLAAGVISLGFAAGDLGGVSGLVTVQIAISVGLISVSAAALLGTGPQPRNSTESEPTR